jgi:chromosome segregation ATPase
MTDKNLDQEKGWDYWANMVVNSLSNLDQQIGALAEEISQINEKLNSEIQKDRKDITDIKVSLGQLVTITNNLKESIVGLSKLSELLRKQGEDIASLKVKAGVWGAISGVVGAIGTLIIYVLSKGLIK